jgi:hypothetical protein
MAAMSSPSVVGRMILIPSGVMPISGAWAAPVVRPYATAAPVIILNGPEVGLMLIAPATFSGRVGLKA